MVEHQADAGAVASDDGVAIEGQFTGRHHVLRGGAVVCFRFPGQACLFFDRGLAFRRLVVARIGAVEENQRGGRDRDLVAMLQAILAIEVRAVHQRRHLLG